MKKRKPTKVCKFCNLEFDDEYKIENICSSSAEASLCSYHPSTTTITMACRQTDPR